MKKFNKKVNDSPMLPAKYHEGQILSDGREVLAYYLLENTYVTLILKALKPSTWSPENGFEEETSDRYDLYMLHKDEMKADTELINDYEFSSNLGCAYFPKNDVVAAKNRAIEYYNSKITPPKEN